MDRIKTRITNNTTARRMAFYAGWSTVKRLWRRFFMKGPTVFILMYHKIAPGAYPYYGTAVTPQIFEKQIRHIVKYYQVEALEDLVKYQNFNDKKDLIAITFDDGYQGVYRWAFPILRNYGLPATVFLSTDYVGSQKLLWHDHLAFILYRAWEGRTFADISYDGLPAEVAASLKSFFKDNGTSANKINSLHQASHHLKAFGQDDRKRILDELCRNFKLKAPFNFSGVMLSWPEIQEMSKHQIYFGSHTCSHTPLSELPPESVMEELRESKDRIENQLQKRVTTFAYPYGEQNDFTSTNVEQVKRCGFQLAVTVIRGNETLPFKNPHTLRRRAVENTPYLFY